MALILWLERAPKKKKIYIKQAIDLNLNQIFSPVDPNNFHKLYSCSIKFLQDFESKCSTQLNFSPQRLHLSKPYKYFLKKWPIIIYYQIRFQEIVFKFEQNLNFQQQLPSCGSSGNDSGAYFNLKITNCLYESLNYCWNEQCFLNCLISNFWKLNLQLLTRFENYYRATIIEQINATNGDAVNDQSPAIQLQQQQPTDADLRFLIYFMVDIRKLCERLPNFFDGNVAPLMRASGVKEIGFVKGNKVL